MNGPSEHNILHFLERIAVSLEALAAQAPRTPNSDDAELTALLPPRYRPRATEIVANIRKHQHNHFCIVRSLKAAGIIASSTNRKHVNFYHAAQKEICGC